MKDTKMTKYTYLMHKEDYRLHVITQTDENAEDFAIRSEILKNPNYVVITEYDHDEIIKARKEQKTLRKVARAILKRLMLSVSSNDEDDEIDTDNGGESEGMGSVNFSKNDTDESAIKVGRSKRGREKVPDFTQEPPTAEEAIPSG